MFNKKSSRHSLALFVALALSSGALLAPSAAGAADVSGQNVAIDDAHAPSNNAEHPGGGAAFGTAAGFIKDEHDNGNVKDNTLTFKNLSYNKYLYGGLTFGTGNVTGNKVFVNPATSSLHSSSDGIFGGAANGGGNVEDNHATFNGNHLNGDLVGGMATDGGTGTVKKNTATLKGGNVHGSIYGGTTGNQANGDVLKNEVLIEGGIVTGTGNVYGGYTDENSNVKGNIVTIKGGILNGIYGGYSSGTGEVSGNTVNLGDGTSAMAAGYAINGTIYGGRNDSHPDKVSNNTLNVNTNATAYNIKNFSTINFNFNAYTNTTQSLLTLNDSHGTTIGSLNDLKLKDAPRGSGTLIENASGLTINSYSGALKLTAEKTETIIDKQGTTKIGYNAYQFRDSTETRSEGLEVWGGRSTIGNTTTKNIVTLNGNYTGRNAYGGRTDGTGSTATGENAKNHSIENTITLDGAGSIVNNMTGGMTLSAGGNATGNRAVLKAGTVNGSLTGGSVGSSGGDVTGNFVDVNGGTVHGKTYGGYASGTGKAEHNTVTLTGGTLNSDIHGGVASSGAAVKNIVNITGGSAANYDVYGGFSTHGDATGNTVNITGGSVRNVDGGRSLNGNATGNTVNIGSADAGFGGSIAGIINGGSGTTYGNDYRTDNKLNVYGNATASNIRNFAEINFHFNSHVNQSASFLNLSDGGGTTIESLDDIHVDGEHGRKGVLLQNTSASGSITITDGQNRRIKTSDDKELILEKSTDNKKITYEGYRFANATEPTTITESGVTSTWGGRSIGGNSTRKNVITVTSGTHTNIYGGWTAGSGTTAEDKDNSYENEVTLDGATTGNLYGGYTDNAAGKAEKNIVTVKSGTISTDLYGGISNKTTGTGDVKKNIVNISGGTVSNVYGGYSAGSGEVSDNEVTATGGTGFNDVRGGYSTSGAANGNKVTLGAVSTGAVTGGHGATAADGNEVTLTGTTVTGDVKGGEGATTKKNIVNLNGGVTINGALKGGTGTPGAAGEENKLNVKGTNSAQSISDFQKLHFDTEGASTTNPLLNVTGGATNLDWNTLDASGTSVNRTTLLKNTNGINLSNHTAGTVKSKINEAGTTEYNIDVAKTGGTITDITYQGYQFKGKTTATTDGADTYGGRSKAGNTTTENELTVDSGSHTNIYGGWTSGAGSTADAAKQKDSIGNKVTVKGTAAATGDVIGGLTEVADGKATGNTVTVEKDLAANIIGGKAAAEASNNIVNLANATVNSVTGGEGATTNNNIVNLNGGANVTGYVKGGTQANGAGNTLNVKGVNSAGTISGFQKLHFDTEGASTTNPLLNITGGATNLDWNTLDASGTSVNRTTLLKNTAGITLTNHTPGTVKSKINEAGTTEYNIDVEKTGSTITDITYQGYQFKGKTTATTEGTDTYGGRSKAGNTTTENELTVDSGNHTNIYGGWTSGAGSSAAPDKQKDSIGNTATVKGTATATGDVIGGLTDVAGGKATGNTVTVEKDLAANIIGGKATSGDASGNTVNLANATVNSITGGDGTTTNNNIVNLNGGANVTGYVKGGTQANGTGNTLNVKGVNSAGTISDFQKLHFDTEGASTTNPLLNITGGTTNLDWNTLDASGTSLTRTTLLKNTVGITLSNHTDGTVKSKINDAGTTEYNIDVEKTSGTITDITYQGYQFKGKTTATTEGTDTYGGRSKAGNTTTENDLTVDSGSHTNIYGGWTSGAGSSAAPDKQKDSIGNKVTVKGTAAATGDVIGGLTDVADGKATGNTVTVEKDLAAANIIGGKAASGDASGNTINLTNATVSSVTGGDGTTTNNNTVNLNGSAQVTGALKGGSQASGTDNTLNVKGKNNKAGSIENIQKMNFDATGLAKDDTMLEITGAAQSDVDWTTLNASGTAAKPLTLLKNANGINLAGYTGAAKSETGETTETNIDVRKTGGTVTEITYEGYQFKDVRQATTVTDAGITNTFGGRSKAGNSTRENEIAVESGTHTNVYGGWTSGSGSTATDKDNSYKNTVTVKGAANVTNTLYGGYTEAAGGKATENTVTVEKDLATANIIGGKAAAEASDNIVNLANATVNSLTGGEGAMTNNNIVNLKGNAQVTGTLTGGSAANGTGNTLNVTGTNNKAGSIAGFQKLTFDAANADANPMLQVTGGATTDADWTNLTATGAASETPKTLMENTSGINTIGRTGDAAKSELNTDATMETNIDVVKSSDKVTALTYEGYTFKGSTKTTTYGADTWAGRSKAGNTTQDNTLTLDDASKTYANVYGGWTSGTGTKAAADKQNNSLNNTVNYTAGTVTGALYGGHAAAGEASGNTVNLGAIQTAANIYGGFGTVTKNNTINLKGARVTGTVYGGSAANGTGNTLAVYRPSEVQDFAGVQNLHFHTDELTAGTTTPLLKLGTTTKDIRGLNIGVDRRGDAPKLKKGDKLLLMKTAGSLTTDDKIENKIEGKQGMARRYTYEIKKENTGELTATVTHAGLGDDAKSPVETRAGLSNLVNQGADYIVESGISAAETALRADAGAGSSAKSDKSAQRKTAATDNASYQLWAGAGANTMRVESGSHVDSKGWNLGVGWAREDEMKDGAKRLFSPFVEYGRGSYDSYLDNGAHGSGTIRYLGIGVLGKLTQKDGLWLEGSVRGGRATSDYQLHGSSDANYDGSNTYYGIHLGIGKTVELRKDAAIDAYARYFWSHQNGMSVKLSSGDDYDFASVDSHRLRLGFRYSQKDQQQGEFYTGLAWEYEFDGEARASIGGDAAPSPSLKGSSTMLELGYRFMPKNSRVSYDLHLNGWQGKRKGISGGVAVKWAF